VTLATNEPFTVEAQLVNDVFRWFINGVQVGSNLTLPAGSITGVDPNAASNFLLGRNRTASGKPELEVAFDDLSIDPRSPVALCQNVSVSSVSTCTADASVDAGSYDPDGDPITVTQSPPGPYSIGLHAVTLSVSDGFASTQCAATITVVDGAAPEVLTITSPVDPIPVNSSINTSGLFTDACDGDDHTATWDWGDNSTSPGTTDQNTNTVSGSHTYTAAGVYTVTLTVEDDAGNTGQASATQFTVVYDPDAGFVTGGGWIDSPSGAYVAEPTLTGKAHFGFVSKYKNGQSTPSGQTQFQFKAADLNFHSSSYDWLVIAIHKAMYKGEGTVNGAGNYGFQVSAIDAALTPSTAVDLFRIRIWDKNDGDALVYDSDVGEDDDNVDPPTAIGGGKIKIHNNGNTSVVSDQGFENVPASYALEQNVPNPFNPQTTIRMALPTAGPYELIIYDVRGRRVKAFTGVAGPGHLSVTWNGDSDAGSPVSSGIYFYKMQAGVFNASKRMLLLK
jgi:hypothetical protein